MHFFFVTRAYQTGNLQKIKDNIRGVFAGSEHSYRHCIVVDLSHGGNMDDFAVFGDSHTEVLFTRMKPEKDSQNANGLQAAAFLAENESDWVYVLDDDNLLHPRFLDVCDHIDGNEDAIVFKIEGRPELGNPDIYATDNAVGKIDWANFIFKANTVSRFGLKDCIKPPRCEDGIFFGKLVRNKCTIAFLNDELAYYNKLRRTW